MAWELPLEQLRKLEDTGKILGILAKSKMIGALASVGLYSCIYSTMVLDLIVIIQVSSRFTRVVTKGTICLKVPICVYYLLSTP